MDAKRAESPYAEVLRNRDRDCHSVLGNCVRSLSPAFVWQIYSYQHEQSSDLPPEKWSNFNEKNRGRGCPPKSGPISMRKIKVNECSPKGGRLYNVKNPTSITAHKPHYSSYNRPAEGMLVRCADGTKWYLFANIPDFPSNSPRT